MINVKISNAKLYLVALAVSAVNDVRYYLNGVKVEKNLNGGINLIATDGHRLIVLHDAEGSITGADGVILPQLKLPKPGRNAVLSLEFTGTDNEVACEVNVYETMRLTSRYVDGRFPEWRAIMPHEHELSAYIEPSSFNPDLLKGFEKVADAYGAQYAQLRLKQFTNEGPMAIHFGGLPVYAVVMPLRSANTTPAPSGLPSFLSAPKPAKASPKASTENKQEVPV